ncbi:zinc ribbon domain-containing protein [Actinomycetospora chlora]|uniref:zinc ribbon domain-containing protein n=1 Tax=Actinomycetospora chlora TaxID=663608 RepID=UPI0031EDADB6
MTAPRAGVPGPVTAARVLIALSGVSGVLWGLVAVGVGLLALSWSRSAGISGNDLGSDELGAFGVTTLGGLAGWLVVIGLLLLVLSALDFLCVARLGRGDRTARALLTAVVLADRVLGVVLGVAVDRQFLVLLVVSVPWALLVLGLLWVTRSARRFFGDEPLPQDVPRSSAPSPYDLPTPALGLPLTPADVVVPARFCSQCGRPNTPGGAFCGQCGASLRHAVARY